MILSSKLRSSTLHGVNLPTRMSPSLTSVPIAAIPFKSRCFVLLSETLGSQADVIYGVFLFKILMSVRGTSYSII